MGSDEDGAGGRLGLGGESITRGLLFAVVLFSFFSIALMQISLGLAFLNWIVGAKRAGWSTVRAPLARPMAAYVVLSVVSGALAMAGPSVKDGLTDGMPMLVYLVTLNVMAQPRYLRRSMDFVIAGGALAALYGLAPMVLERTGLRIQGSLSHYYTFSGVVMVAVVVGIARLVFSNGGRERVLVAAGTTCMVVALLFTQTRSAWLAVLVGALVVLLARERRLLPLLPVLAVIAYFLAPAHVQDRIRSTVDTTDATANERVAMWETGWRIFQDEPVFGIGPRRVPFVYGDYRDPDSPYTDTPIPGHLHNNIVNIGVERGVTGLLAWLVFWLAWFARTAGIHRLQGRGSDQDLDSRAAVVGAFAAMLAFQVMGLFEYNAGDSEVATLAMFVMGLPLAAEGALRRGFAEPDVATP